LYLPYREKKDCEGGKGGSHNGCVSFSNMILPSFLILMFLLFSRQTSEGFKNLLRYLREKPGNQQKI
jgi:hypothetical protein